MTKIPSSAASRSGLRAEGKPGSGTAQACPGACQGLPEDQARIGPRSIQDGSNVGPIEEGARIWSAFRLPIRFSISLFAQTEGKPHSSRPMTQPDPLSTLAWLPDLPDCTRLLEAFLAGRSPRTLAAYRADLEDFRCYTGPSNRRRCRQVAARQVRIVADALVRIYRSEMSKRDLQATTINRRLATLRSLVKRANTHGLVTWTLSVENVPVQPYATRGPDRDGFYAMLEAAGAQPGPKGLRDVALLRLLHDLGLRRSEAVRLDIDAVDLQRNRIVIPGKGRSPKQPVSLPEPTRAALAAWLEARGPEPGPLFVNFDRAGKGHRLTGAAVYHIVGGSAPRPGSGPPAWAAPCRDHHRARADQRRYARGGEILLPQGPAHPQPLLRQPIGSRRQGRSLVAAE